MKKLLLPSEKIFIAGANGMVGNAIKRILQKSGYGNTKNDGELYTPSRKELDLTNHQEVKEWFEKYRPTIVIIAAAKVGGILANATQPANFILENLKIQTNIIENAWLMGVKRLLFLGSSCIYPKFASQPIKEEYLLDGSLEQTNEYYAIAKIAGLKLCESLRIQHGFDCISLMPTNLYGPGDNYHTDNSHVMAAFIRKFVESKKESEKKVICWGSGKPLREFLHVDDLANASLFCLEYWDPNSENAPQNKYGNLLTYLNVGTGKVITIYDLAKKIAKLTDYQGEIIWDESKPDGTPIKQLDISKITKLGWLPEIKLNEGISKTINIFKNLIY